jgi:prolyl-tRNA synthetase
MTSAVVGANEKDFHRVDVNPQSDFVVSNYVDLRSAAQGDPCPRCSGKLVLSRGIEVGHVFKLGVKYSEAMNATFLDAHGVERPMVMGCYGIGVSRTVAAAIEQNHDADGIIFPPAIAPFSVIVTPVGAQDADIESTAEAIYRDLWANNIDTLLDDRDERPGVKFKDADLIGIPFRITVGKKALSRGMVELRDRQTRQTELVEVSRVMEALRTRLQEWKPLATGTV